MRDIREHSTFVLDSASVSFYIVGERVNVVTPDFVLFIHVILAFSET
jgi:hypothetical protein